MTIGITSPVQFTVSCACSPRCAETIEVEFGASPEVPIDLDEAEDFVLEDIAAAGWEDCICPACLRVLAKEISTTER